MGVCIRMTTLLQRHLDKWIDCQDCDLCKTRNKVVQIRGQIPCDVLLVGEAPGASENNLGAPFVGPAGHLLDRQIDEALSMVRLLDEEHPIAIAFCNLVACIPLGEDGKKTAEPSRDQIKACQSRLVDLMGIAQPRMIILVGRLAAKNLPSLDSSILIREIRHPAAILRETVATQAMSNKRVVVQLRDAFEGI